VGYAAYFNSANNLLCFFAAQSVSGVDTIWQQPAGDNDGCIPPGYPSALPFLGPPIGFSATTTAAGYTGFQFIFDACWCARSQINPFTFPSETVTTEGLTPTIPMTWSTPKHALQGVWPLATDCAIELRVNDFNANIFTVNQVTSELTLLPGVPPGVYLFSVEAYLKDHPDAGDMSFISPISTIKVQPNLPACYEIQLAGSSTGVYSIQFDDSKRASDVGRLTSLTTWWDPGSFASRVDATFDTGLSYSFEKDFIAGFENLQATISDLVTHF